MKKINCKEFLYKYFYTNQDIFISLYSTNVGTKEFIARQVHNNGLTFQLIKLFQHSNRGGHVVTLKVLGNLYDVSEYLSERILVYPVQLRVISFGIMGHARQSLP